MPFVRYQLRARLLACFGYFTFLIFVLLSSFTPRAVAEDAATQQARMSIVRKDLLRHLDVLADDTLEGRASGTRGGHAAARYLVDQLKKLGLSPVGTSKHYEQVFSANYQNILVEIPGSDEKLRGERILIGAHYDHVGYGSTRTSYGPIGYIHNGADDNASGVSALLELAEALKKHPTKLRRTVQLCFWDGEEQGLLGARHWTANPTVPLETVKLYVNIDMIGRLRKSRIIVGGTRTGYGLRRLAASTQLKAPLWLDFDWELKENSDHWPFVGKHVPVLTLFTGLHEDYHRPSDDVERLNIAGIEHVTRYLFDFVERAANADTLPKFRAQGTTESPYTRRTREIPLAPQPTRLGIAFRDLPPAKTTSEEGVQQAEHTVPAKNTAKNRTEETKVKRASATSMKIPRGVEVTSVVQNSPAAIAQLQPGDVILAIGDLPLTSQGEFSRWLLASPKQSTLKVLPKGKTKPIEIPIRLHGTPIRLGISWRSDDAEPNAVYLTRVVPGSLAQQAKLRVFDRILAVDGKPFQSMAAFQAMLNESLSSEQDSMTLLVESFGRLREITVPLSE